MQVVSSSSVPGPCLCVVLWADAAQDVQVVGCVLQVVSSSSVPGHLTACQAALSTLAAGACDDLLFTQALGCMARCFTAARLCAWDAFTLLSHLSPCRVAAQQLGYMCAWGAVPLPRYLRVHAALP
jgi:hypothetical protein